MENLRDVEWIVFDTIYIEYEWVYQVQYVKWYLIDGHEYMCTQFVFIFNSLLRSFNSTKRHFVMHTSYLNRNEAHGVHIENSLVVQNGMYLSLNKYLYPKSLVSILCLLDIPDSKITLLVWQHLLPLMNSFIKTVAAIFPMQVMIL